MNNNIDDWYLQQRLSKQPKNKLQFRPKDKKSELSKIENEWLTAGMDDNEAYDIEEDQYKD